MHGPPAQREPRRPRRAPLAALFTTLSLAACSAPQARFSTISELPPDLRSAVMFRGTGEFEDGQPLYRMDIDQRYEGDLPDRPVLIPFTDERPWARPGDRGRPMVQAMLWPLVGSNPHPLRAVVDTGAASTLILSRDAAHRSDVWISAEIGPHEGIGFVGPVPAGEGLARRMQIGPMSLAPADVKVNTAQEGQAAAIGLSAFMAYGGLVFDWDNHVIIALPRGRAVHVDPRWVEVAWSPIPRTTLERWTPDGVDNADADQAAIGTESGGQAAAPDASRVPSRVAWSMTTHFRGTPVVQAAVAGESLRVVLDTGGDGHLASLRPLAVLGRGRARQVASHGRIQAMREHTLDGSVRIGPIVYDRPTVVVPDPATEMDPALSDASLQYFDAVVGVELLRKQPVWFDFERGVVRFLPGDAPLPALTPARGTRSGA